MPGGIMNLISVGAQNIILNGNPKKTFFKVATVIVKNRKNDEILVKNPRAINTEPNDSERDARKPKKT